MPHQGSFPNDYQAGPLRSRASGRRWLLITGLLLFAGICAGSSLLPQLANHYGFALPRAEGLPYSVHALGRDYISHETCAGAGWCNDNKPVCRSAEYLRAQGVDLSKEVGSIPTLFGQSHRVVAGLPAFGSGSTASVPIQVYVLDVGDCYLEHGLSGGL